MQRKKIWYPAFQANNDNKFHIKRRALYTVVICIIVLLGLGSRYFAAVLLHFVAIHFGDALWASVVYFVVRFFLIDKSPAFITLLSLMLSFVIETSQLYQAGWINEIRRTLPGSLILGRGFLWIDLLRYTSGVIFAWGVDKIIIYFKKWS